LSVFSVYAVLESNGATQTLVILWLIYQDLPETPYVGIVHRVRLNLVQRGVSHGNLYTRQRKKLKLSSTVYYEILQFGMCSLQKTKILKLAL
jgi:hypothetical protein